MNPNDVQQIIEKYGRPAWEAAQRQVYVELLQHVIGVLFLLTLIVVLWSRWGEAKRWVETVDSYERDVAWGLGFVGTRVLPVLLSIFLVLVVNDTITYVVNPTWAAISIILGALPHA